MSDAPRGSFTILIVGFVGLMLIFSLPSALGDDVLGLTIFSLAELAFISVFMTLILAFDPGDGTDDELEQRKGESNGRYLVRVWWTITKFFIKAPFMAVVLLPSKLSEAHSWLRQSPSDNHE